MQRRDITFRFTKAGGPAEVIIESTPAPSNSQDVAKDATIGTAAAPVDDPTLIPYR